MRYAFRDLLAARRSRIGVAIAAALLLLSRLAAAAGPESDLGAVSNAAPPIAPDPGCVAGAGNGKALAQQIGPQPVTFTNSPFPYQGMIPGQNKEFLDKIEGGRKGHTSPRGSLHWEDVSYSDRHSLVYIPKGFDVSRPALMVVFFHGNHAILTRDVERRQRVPAQLAASGLNAVLVAPQFGYDVADSSAGSFWQPGVFGRFLEEAAQHLGSLTGNRCLQPVFNKMPVVLVAYSGGYNPAAYAIDVGGANARLHGVILLDALYGETDKFDRWLARRGSAFFFSAYSESSRSENLSLQQSLTARGQAQASDVGRGFILKPGSVTFLPIQQNIRHNDFVTDAWVHDPLTAVLAAIEGFRRTSVGSQKRRPDTASSTRAGQRR